VYYNANNNGPNTLPCGTPDDSAHVSDLFEPMATYCDRSETQDVSQRSATPVTRYILLGDCRAAAEKFILFRIYSE